MQSNINSTDAQCISADKENGTATAAAAGECGNQMHISIYF